MPETKKTNWDPQLYQDKHHFVYGHGQSLIELLAPKSHESILDLGCGSGQLTNEIGLRCRSVVGMDASVEMIKAARSRYPDIVFRQADAANFNFDEPFDAIFSNAALHWVLDYKGAIRSIYQHLAYGGRLVAELGGVGNIETILKCLKSTLSQYGYEEQANLNLWYFPSPGAYATELEAAGFRVSLMQHYDRPTLLEDENSGIVDWLTMFASSFFGGVEKGDTAAIKMAVQEGVKPHLFKEDKWYADYKRLRVIAVK